MKKYFLIIVVLLIAFSATATRAQTTVATFDNPLCSGNGVGVYQGIDFSLSPWDCENPGLAGQTGTSISWYQSVTTGHFGFQVPGVLVSLSAATSSGSGVLTISTDAGETFSHSINTTFQTLQTGFSKAASVITVQFPGGWTIELDNIAFRKPTAAPTAASLTVSGSLNWDDGTPVAGSIALVQLLGTSSSKTLATLPVSSTGSVNGAITIDLTQPDPLTFQIVLLSPTNAAIGTTNFQVIKAMFPPNATGITARIVLWKATSAIKTFDLGLTP